MLLKLFTVAFTSCLYCVSIIGDASIPNESPVQVLTTLIAISSDCPAKAPGALSDMPLSHTGESRMGFQVSGLGLLWPNPFQPLGNSIRWKISVCVCSLLFVTLPSKWMSNKRKLEVFHTISTPKSILTFVIFSSYPCSLKMFLSLESLCCRAFLYI